MVSFGKATRLELWYAIALTLIVTSCANPRSVELFADAPPARYDGIAGTEHIFVATTRVRSEDPRAVYTGMRAETASYVEIDVSVPAAHKTGALELRKGKSADPAKYFTARSIANSPDLGTFVRSVAADAALEKGRALVFVHGYNTQFDEAVYRLTQIAHDSNYGGAPVLFAWASGGKPIDYVYDRDSATAARDALEQLLREMASSGVKRIDIVAHSMGTWLTMEALRGLAISGDHDLDGRLGDVVLASPDIDYQVFRTQMHRYGRPDRPFFVLLSGDDRALRFSALIAGKQPRLGEYSKAKDIAELGVIVADMSPFKAGDPLNHTKFADNPFLVKLLGEGLRENRSLGSDREMAEGLTALVRRVGSSIGAATRVVVTTPTGVIDVDLKQ